MWRHDLETSIVPYNMCAGSSPSATAYRGVLSGELDDGGSAHAEVSWSPQPVSRSCSNARVAVPQHACEVHALLNIGLSIGILPNDI